MYKYKVKVQKVSGSLNESVLPSKKSGLLKKIQNELAEAGF